MRFVLLFCLFLTPLFGEMSEQQRGQIRFLAHQGRITEALELYKRCATEDYDLLRDLCFGIIEQGANSSDPKQNVMAIFGAGAAASPRFTFILEQGLRSEVPEVQLAALSFAGRLYDPSVDHLIDIALSSPFLVTRLEATYLLAKRQEERVLGHLDAIWVKVPPLLHPLLTQVYATIDTPLSSTKLRRFLSHPNKDVRIATILQAAKGQRDELLPQIRMHLASPEPDCQEACVLACSRLRDSSSIEKIRSLSHASSASLRLTSLRALYGLGEKAAEREIRNLAAMGDLDAIFLLGSLPECKSQDLLDTLTSHPDRDVRLNAVCSLLQLRDSKALKGLDEFLFEGTEDLGFMQVPSAGRGVKHWQALPSAEQQLKLRPTLKASTRNLRSKLLTASLELPEKEFLTIAKRVFMREEKELIPLLISCLANHKSADTLQLLQEQEQQTGSPFTRLACALTLYRMGEKGPHLDTIRRWIAKERKELFLEFEEPPPIRQWRNGFTLLPKERSMLLLEAFETLASSQSKEAVEILVDAIAYGHPLSRAALAGLLTLAIE